MTERACMQRLSTLFGKLTVPSIFKAAAHFFMSQTSVSISAVHLTSGLSLCSPTPSLVSLADSLTGKEHGGGVTHAWEDTPGSTSAPISFSSTGKPALVSGNDHPHEAGPSSLGTTRREASHWATASLGGGKSGGWEVLGTKLTPGFWLLDLELWLCHLLQIIP